MALVFGRLFFLASDPLTATLQSFAVFAVGFVARPVGAAIFWPDWAQSGPDRNIAADRGVDFSDGLYTDFMSI